MVTQFLRNVGNCTTRCSAKPPASAPQPHRLRDFDGKLIFTRPGGYATEAKLDEDIRNYALDG